MKRVILWTLIPLILAPLLFVGLTYLATRLINQDAVKDRIETTVSRDLGGQIRYERVGLTILPRPQVVITNPSITVPGSLEAKSKSLKVTFELLPLLVGNARLADIRLDDPDVTLVLEDEPSEQGRADSPSSHQSLPSVLGRLAAAMPNLAIRIDHGHLAFVRRQNPVFALDDATIRLAFSATTPPDRTPSGAEPFRIVGSARGVLTSHPSFPGPVKIRIDAFEAGPHTIAFSDSEMQVLDAALTISGRFDGYSTPDPAADFTLSGPVGPEAVRWIRTIASLPPAFALRTPVALSRLHVSWKRGGTTVVDGSASVRRSVAVSFNVERSPTHVTIRQLHVKDVDSDAKVTVDLDQRSRLLDLSFKGALTESTLGRLFERERSQIGWLRGDFTARIVLDRPRESTAQGDLEGEQVPVPKVMPVPVLINRIKVQAHERTVAFDPLVVTLGTTQQTVRGRVSASADEWVLDLAADHVAWEPLAELFAHAPAPGSVPAATEDARSPAETPPPVRATIRLNVGSFTAGGWTAAPARADIVIGPRAPEITVHEAVVCGITVAGSATIAADVTRIALTPSAKGQDLAPTMACLIGQPMGATGSFDVSGRLEMTGTGKALLDHLDGAVALSVKGGHFRADSAVVKILSYLNVTDLLRGSFPDPGAEGIPYKSLVVRGTARQGRLLIDEAVLKSSIAQMAARGSLDLGNQLFDITVLVAPLTTVDAVVKKIPLVRDILAGSLVTIPVRVTGPFDQPKVDAVPPSAVADELAGIMKRTLQLPFKILEPVIPGGKKHKEGGSDGAT